MSKAIRAALITAMQKIKVADGYNYTMNVLEGWNTFDALLQAAPALQVIPSNEADETQVGGNIRNVFNWSIVGVILPQPGVDHYDALVDLKTDIQNAIQEDTRLGNSCSFAVVTGAEYDVLGPQEQISHLA